MNRDADPNDPDFEDLSLPDDYPVDQYWDIVKKAVRRVFKVEDRDKEIDKLRKQVRESDEKQSPEKKYGFYQTEPYSVAADIAGKNGAGTEEQWREYLKIKQESKFGTSADSDIPGNLMTPFRLPASSEERTYPFSDE